MKTKIFRDPIHLAKFLAKGHKARTQGSGLWCHYNEKTANPFQWGDDVMGPIWYHADGRTIWEIEKRKKHHPRTKSHKAMGIELKKNDTYYVPSFLGMKDDIYTYYWDGSKYDEEMFEKGITFTNRKDAASMVKKMLKIVNKDKK